MEKENKYITSNPNIGFSVTGKLINSAVLVQLFLVITVFSKELFTRTIGGVMIDTYGYVFLGFVFMLSLSTLQIARELLFLYVWLLLTSLYAIFFMGVSVFPFIKQAIPILFIYFTTYHLLFKYKSNLRSVFELYVTIAYYTAIFGIFQYWACKFGLCFLIGFTGKLDSIAYEPSHYAAIIMPAVIYTVMQARKYKIRSVVFLLTLIFTESLTSIAVFFIVLIIPKLKVIYLPFIILLFWGMYKVLPLIHDDFAKRITAAELVIRHNDFSTKTTGTGTIVSFASNLDVAIYTLKKNPISGSGLGGHESMYTKRFKGTFFEDDYFYGLNQLSAHSLTIRILSEMGLIGFIAYIVFLVKGYIKKEESYIPHLISLSCISHFLCKTLKLGGYIDYGTPFFFCILLINYHLYKKWKKKE